MGDYLFLKFFYNFELIYESPCRLKEEHLDTSVLCSYFIEKPYISFGFNKVVVCSFNTDIYWMSFDDTKYVVKNNYPIEVKFNRLKNALHYIMED